MFTPFNYFLGYIIVFLIIYNRYLERELTKVEMELAYKAFFNCTEEVTKKHFKLFLQMLGPRPELIID